MKWRELFEGLFRPAAGEEFQQWEPTLQRTRQLLEDRDFRTLTDLVREHRHSELLTRGIGLEMMARLPLLLTSPDEAAHALRELSWGEHFVAGRMVPSKGGSDLYLYNLHSAAVFLLDRDEARVGKGADQIIKLIDVDAFVAWLRDTVGDAALADAIARECPADDPYRDRLENVQRLLALRMVQYGAASDAMNAADAEQDEGA